MQIINKTTIFIIVIITILAGWNIFQYVTKPKTGYVVISEIYNGFELKKDLEKKYQVTASARQKILDSLLLEIKLIEKKINIKAIAKPSDTIGYNALIEDYMLKKQTYDEDNTTISEKYDEQIITQLNQYVKDYGKAYNYTYIFGTGGTGSLMYADENGEDITKDVIVYINKKFNGEIK